MEAEEEETVRDEIAKNEEDKRGRKIIETEQQNIRRRRGAGKEERL